MVGGGSGTKSTLIISIDSGSTVQVYSNSTYTTLLKTATEKSAGQFWVKGLDNGTYYIKATKGTDEATLAYTISEYGVYRITMAYRLVPAFTYTGSYELVHDDDTPIDTTSQSDMQSPWKIRFLESGNLSFTNMYGSINGIDVFLVGAGGGGGGASSGAGSGGGGGYTETHRAVSVATNTDYIISIGNGGALRTDGGSSSGFGYTANGGSHGNSGSVAGGAGGSGGGAGGSTGGAGGSDGNNGGNVGSVAGGSGQGTTTREFAENGATLYAGGGGGAVGGAGGAGGGATAGSSAAVQENTGGGGAGGANTTTTAQAGANGIVIIRNARS